jgi:hypothetical protein
MAKKTSTINIDAGIHEELKMLSLIDQRHITSIVEEQLRKLLQRRSEDIERARKALEHWRKG